MQLLLTNIPFIPTLAAALLAVAFGHVWYGICAPILRNETSEESVMSTVWSVFVHFCIFAVLTQFLYFVSAGYVQFTYIAVLAVLPAVLQHALSTTYQRPTVRVFLVRAAYTFLTMVGGLFVIVYWPW